MDGDHCQHGSAFKNAGHTRHAHAGHSPHAGHSHGGGAGHAHGSVTFGQAFAIGIALNVAIVLVQVVFGILGNSVALLADAGHNFSDALSLSVAWGASVLAAKSPSARLTYGLKGASILAALFNAVLLLVIVGGLSWEALWRLRNIEPVAGGTVSLVAAFGLVVNGACAWLFLGGRDGDLNVRGAFMHMAADAAISAGVVAAGLGILITGWLWLDPLVSLALNAIVIWGTWSLLRESAAMALNAVPESINPTLVRDYLQLLRGVSAVHDLHIWPMSTTEIAMTAHLVVPAGHPGDAFLLQISAELHDRFRICHTTLQIEQDGARCSLAPDHVV